MEETENAKWCVFKVPQYIIPLVTFLDFFGGDGNGSLNPDVEAFSGDILLKGNFVFN